MKLFTILETKILSADQSQVVFNDYLTTLIKQLELEFPPKDLSNSDIEPLFKKRLLSLLPLQNIDELITALKKESTYSKLTAAFQAFFDHRKNEHPAGLYDQLVANE